MQLNSQQRYLMSEQRLARTIDALDDCRMALSQVKSADEELQSDIEFAHSKADGVLKEWRELN